MGILGELNQMAKAGRIEQLHAYLNNENIFCDRDFTDISACIGFNDARTAGAYRRLMHHNAEISIASYR